MDTSKIPTYQDLLDFLPHFIDAEMDVRVFRAPKRMLEVVYRDIMTQEEIDNITTNKLRNDLSLTFVNKKHPFHLQQQVITERLIRDGKEHYVAMFSIGDWPVEKKFARDIPLTSTFINDEIQKIRDQKEFDKTVKPYPHRDIYYQLLINDLRDLSRLSKYLIQYNKNKDTEATKAE